MQITAIFEMMTFVMSYHITAYCVVVVCILILRLYLLNGLFVILIREREIQIFEIFEL